MRDIVFMDRRSPDGKIRAKNCLKIKKNYGRPERISGANGQKIAKNFAKKFFVKTYKNGITYKKAQKIGKKSENLPLFAPYYS